MEELTLEQKMQMVKYLKELFVRHQDFNMAATLRDEEKRLLIKIEENENGMHWSPTQ